MPKRTYVVRRNRHEPEPGWSLTTNEYRIGVGVLFVALISILTWLGNGVISGQSEIRDELEEGSAVLNTVRTEIANMRSEMTRLDTVSKAESARLEGLVRDQDNRLTRTNERQVDQSSQITRIETLLSTFKK